MRLTVESGAFVGPDFWEKFGRGQKLGDLLEFYRKLWKNDAEWKKRGFSKNGLLYMKKKTKSDKPFTINKHVRERLGTLVYNMEL